MGRKNYEIVECKCDRCGNIETLRHDNDATPHKRERPNSSGLLVILGSDSLFKELGFIRIITANEQPESTNEVRVWLCCDCRGELATFLNAKQ